jgi:ribosomal protein S18 acetylase RimI-like enzyme
MRQVPVARRLLLACDRKENTAMSQPASIAIRPATPADAASVRALVRAAYAKWVPGLGREPMPMTADYDRAIREHQVRLLHVDGEMAALIEMILRGNHLYVENVAVLPERQGEGFGRLLLAHAEEVASARGLPEIRLLTNGAWGSNIALYQALGYRIDREEPFMGGTAVYMSKTIAKAARES